MPELPEVETIARGLRQLIVRRSVASVEARAAKSFPVSPDDAQQFLRGATVQAVRRRAKVLLIELSSGYSLMIHLKMTGQLVFVGEQRFGAGHPSDSLVGRLPDASTRVIITFTDGSHLYFNDQRKFGWIKLIPTAEVAQEPFMQKVGPEPLDESFTAEAFAARFTRRGRSNIKAALLDQSVVAGVGNIYADESLWRAQLSPTRLVGSFSQDEFARLFTALRDVMQQAIDQGGSTDRTYVNAAGEKGNYLTFAGVFGRQGQPCRRCGAEIKKYKWAGRGTHVCLVCQPLDPGADLKEMR